MLSRAVALRQIELFIKTQDINIIIQLTENIMSDSGNHFKFSLLKECPFVNSNITCRSFLKNCPLYMSWRKRFPYSYCSCAFSEISMLVHGGGPTAIKFIMSELLLALIIMVGTVKADMTAIEEKWPNRLP